MKERVNVAFEWLRDRYASGLDWCLAQPQHHGRRVGAVVRRVARHRVHARRRVHAEARRRRALGSRDDAVHDLVRGIVADRAAGARRFSPASPKSPSSRRSTAATTPAPTRQDSSMPSSMSGSSRTASGTARFTRKDAADRRDHEEAVGVSRHHLQLHATGRRRGRRSAHRPQGVARREGLRHRPRACSSRRDARSRASSRRSPASTTSRSCRSSASRA